jgi:hypothetical protein
MEGSSHEVVGSKQEAVAIVGNTLHRAGIFVPAVGLFLVPCRHKKKTNNKRKSTLLPFVPNLTRGSKYSSQLGISANKSHTVEMK